MTVQLGEPLKAEVAGNGVATEFPISGMVFYEAGDLFITHVSALGAETLLEEGVGPTNYSVVLTPVGAGSIGFLATVTYPADKITPMATGERLIVKRVLPFEQSLDLENQGGYFPDLVEQALDRLTYLHGQQQEELERAVKVTIGDDTDPSKLVENIINAEANAAASAAAAAGSASAAENAAQAAEDAAATLPNASGTGANNVPQVNPAGDGWTEPGLPVGSGTGALLRVDGDGSQLTGIDAGAGQVAYDNTGSGLDAVDVQAAIDEQMPTLGTEQATTSGTSRDFTGIPSWVKRITFMLEGVSTNGTTGIRIILGDAGGLEISGYAGIADGPTQTNHSSAFFITTSTAAAGLYHGVVELTLKNSASNTWSISALVGRSDSAAQVTTKVVGSKSLSGPLTQIRLSADGTDTFDAGSVNILYE